MAIERRDTGDGPVVTRFVRSPSRIQKQLHLPAPGCECGCIEGYGKVYGRRMQGDRFPGGLGLRLGRAEPRGVRVLCGVVGTAAIGRYSS